MKFYVSYVALCFTHLRSFYVYIHWFKRTQHDAIKEIKSIVLVAISILHSCVLCEWVAPKDFVVHNFLLII